MRATLALACLIVSLSPACDSNGASTSPVCTAGKVEACPCPGGAQGSQACKSDGSGFDACSCPSSGGASGAGGSSPGGGAGAGGLGAGGSAGAAGSSAGLPEEKPGCRLMSQGCMSVDECCPSNNEGEFVYCAYEQLCFASDENSFKLRQMSQHKEVPRSTFIPSRSCVQEKGCDACCAEFSPTKRGKCVESLNWACVAE